ncbi:AAA family ATPase [Paenibacillus sp. FSL P4-0288]|uniref:AAA family ATPase n=1 Tax=Paenibacillus sp. FSL P4-0288 TaxID=2921633 RepID=UPI0030F7C9D0
MKKLLIVGIDERLKNEFVMADPDIDVVIVRADTGFDKDVKFDTVIISDREIQPMGLAAYITPFKDTKIYYLISNNLKTSIIDNKIAICEQSNVAFVPPKQSLKQIVHIVLGIQKNRSSVKKVISVMGTHPQCGTTMTALCLASLLKEKTNLTVAVLGLNSFNPGSLFMNYQAPSLDEFYDQIAESRRALKGDEMINYVHTAQNGVVYLAGNQDFTKRFYFKSDDIGNIIQIFSDQYDIVVLDVGCSPDNNLTIQGLLHSDIKILVTNQQTIGQNLWARMNSDILRLLNISNEEFLMVVNKYRPDFPSDSRALQQVMNVPVIGTIQDFSSEGLLCELEGYLLIESKDKNTKKRAIDSFGKIADSLRSSLTNSFSQPNEKKSLFKWKK